MQDWTIQTHHIKKKHTHKMPQFQGHSSRHATPVGRQRAVPQLHCTKPGYWMKQCTLQDQDSHETASTHFCGEWERVASLAQTSVSRTDSHTNDEHCSPNEHYFLNDHSTMKNHKIQTQKGSYERLFILTQTHSMQIFGEIPFVKPQNDT